MHYRFLLIAICKKKNTNQIVKDHDLASSESYKILRHFDEAIETKLKNRLTKVGCERFGELAEMFDEL